MNHIVVIYVIAEWHLIQFVEIFDNRNKKD